MPERGPAHAVLLRYYDISTTSKNNTDSGISQDINIGSCNYV